MSSVPSLIRRPTGLDAALALDGVYYSAPIPRNAAVLTVMGAVFDRVYFPGVYLPKGGYDEKELQREIDRLRTLPVQGRNTAEMIGLLEFVRHARTLDGFCIFTGDGASAFPDSAPEQMARDLFFAIHGPQGQGWQPWLDSGHYKAIPGSDEHVSWPGDYHYLAGSLIESGRTGVPLLNDLPDLLPIPGLADQATPSNDERTLSAVLAIECTKLALPPMPVLRPEHLMEFRAENKEALRAFRRSMLQYAGDLNDKVKGLSPADFEQATRFFIQTEVVPVMDALRSSMSDPARPWYNRVADHARVVAELGASFFAMDPTAAIAKALANYAGVLGAEVTARGDQRQNLRRSGLYYLLSLQKFHETHGT